MTSITKPQTMILFKAISLIMLAMLLSSFSAPHCKCRIMKFNEEVAYADHIFTGTVLKRTTPDLAHYTFVVVQTFKGNKTDTLIIKTGSGGGDCGMEFNIGKTYLVYSREGYTSYCRRNALLENTEDLEKLKQLSIGRQ